MLLKCTTLLPNAINDASSDMSRYTLPLIACLFALRRITSSRRLPSIEHGPLWPHAHIFSSVTLASLPLTTILESSLDSAVPERVEGRTAP